MLFHCWPSVFDACPTLKQHWVNASHLLGVDLKPFDHIFGIVTVFTLSHLVFLPDILIPCGQCAVRNRPTLSYICGCVCCL